HLLQDNWKELITERTYVAVCEGVFENKNGVISSYLHENKNFKVFSDQNPEGGKKAITNYNVLKSNQHYSMLEVRLDTGRKNQIRVHMQDLGHSIIYDRKYGSTVNPINRMGLHSMVLGFIHPITKKQHRFTTPIPRKFERLF
ncbi:MAG: RNA pseudouridine synthase, partial [Prolixibacteraceae bacterium]|nr:RNA pseudouridine synthase [Prolixibacteraceae bacterium]